MNRKRATGGRFSASDRQDKHDDGEDEVGESFIPSHVAKRLRVASRDPVNWMWISILISGTLVIILRFCTRATSGVSDRLSLERWPEFKHVTLWNGVSMPRLGFGTAAMRGSNATEAIGWALEAGFRHFDSAEAR